uniref:Annexin n=1 Tax=Brassica oleracea TaxID=3712 RepID=A0A3P6GBG6_BRAOL|nr:unnamed protein product [Brassica oleracea]
MATLKVSSSVPSPSEDAEQLKTAFEGWGTNEDLIISILAHRSAEQRKLIRQTYHEVFGEDLLKSLDKELSSDFERAILLWTLEPGERDALLANEATKRWTSSNQVLMEVACTRTSTQLLHARQAYHARFKKSIEEDVAHHTTGDFRKLLVSLVSSYRYEGDEVNMTLAKQEAKLIHERIKDKHYSDEEVIRILSTRSKAQINATFNRYQDDHGRKSSSSAHKDLNFPKFLELLRSTIQCLTRPELYFVDVLRSAINKTGTNEGALTRIVTTRAEIDLKVIGEEYQRRNSIPLEKAITKDTRGDYEKMLVALLGEDDA